VTREAHRHCALGAAHLEAGRNREALRAAERALGIDPELEWAHRLRAYALIGLADHFRMRIEPIGLRRRIRALEAAREAARLDPEGRAALITLVEALLARRTRRSRREALVVAERLVMLAPDDPATHNTLGRVFLKRHRWKDAEAAYRRALALDPHNYVALNNLGVAIRRAARWYGPRRAARAELEVRRTFAYAAEADPQSRVAKKNLSTFSGGFFIRRLQLLVPVWLLLHLRGPGTGDPAAWAARATRTTAISFAILVVGATAIRYAAARDLPEGPRRFLHDEARGQRWRFWLGGAVVALYVLVRWLASSTAEDVQAHLLLFALLVTAVAVGAWQTAGAARSRYASRTALPL
jgi:hypothetical protein